MEAINKYFIDVIKKQYVDFQGRATRTQYWMFVLFQSIVFIVISILAAIGGDSILGTIFGIVYVIAYLAVLLPNLAISVRRLHDTDRSGWWLLISFIPLIGALVLLVFFCLPSTPGQNRFGN